MKIEIKQKKSGRKYDRRSIYIELAPYKQESKIASELNSALLKESKEPKENENKSAYSTSH